MKFLLIILMTGNVDGGKATLAIEFDSKESCEQAAKDFFYKYYILTGCYKK